MKQHPTMYTLRKNIKSSVYYVVFILLGLKKSSRKKNILPGVIKAAQAWNGP